MSTTHKSEVRIKEVAMVEFKELLIQDLRITMLAEECSLIHILILETLQMVIYLVEEIQCKCTDQHHIIKIITIQLLVKTHSLLKIDLVKMCLYVRFVTNLDTLLMLIGIDMLKILYLNVGILVEVQDKDQHIYIYTDFVARYKNSYGVDYSSYPMIDMNSSSSFSTPGAAYVANYEGPADKGWYLDSGATHHLTNNMANMHVRNNSMDQIKLIIGNGQGLSITYW